MDIHKFSVKELARAKKRVSRKYFSVDSTRTNKQPIGILLSGQPASGKSGLILKIQIENTNPEFAAINGDEYRQYHPRAQENRRRIRAGCPEIHATVLQYLSRVPESRMPALALQFYH